MTTRDMIEAMSMAVTFARILPDASSFRIANGVAKLARLGREAHTHAENVCNYPMPEGKDEKRRESIKRRAIAVLADMGLDATWHKAGNAGRTPGHVGALGDMTRDVVIEVHGDPRGSCLQIEVKAPNPHMLQAPIRFRF